MKTKTKLRNLLKLFLLLLLGVIAGCDDDNELNNTLQNESQNLTSKTISGKDIPNIIGFVRNQSNDELEFSLGLKNNDNRSEENLTIGTIQTDEIKQITNQANRSNYTFQVTKESADEELSFINYIIKESPDSYYTYFLEYVPDISWLKIAENPNNLSNYTGKIRFYDRNGHYVTEITYSDGNQVEYTSRTACDDGNSGTGGGGGSGTGGTGTGGTGTGGTGTGGGGNDGGISTCTNIGPQEVEIECPPGCNCTLCTIAVITFECDLGDQKSVQSMLRNPCTDDCNSQNDCVFGFDANCGCLPDPNDDTDDNPNDGVFLDIECIAENINLSANSPFNVNLSSINPCNSDQIDLDMVENNAKFMCIYTALANTDGFKSLFIDTFGQSVEADITFKLVDLDDMIAGLTSLPAGAANVDNQIIEMNINHLNTRHPIDFAKNIIHEAIHAYLNVQVFECANGTTVDSINNQELEELLISMDYGCISTADNDHDIMFEGFIPVMQQILNEAFDDLVALEDHNPDINYFPPPNGDLHTFDWQEALYYLSLDGLGNTEAFDTEINENETQNALFDDYIMDIRNPNSLNQNSCN